MTTPKSSSPELLSWDEIVRLDQQHVWHPYAPLPNSVPCLPVKRADGCVITLTDDTQLMDGMSSWWACIHGYNHPVLNRAAQDQIGKMSHMMFGGLTHEPAVLLAQELIDAVPKPNKEEALLDKVFYCDSGSVSVEVAMKMALQYWYTLGQPEKTKLLTIRGGYHGDTFQAMSVCDPEQGMHHLFSKVLPQQLFCPRPTTLFHEEWNTDDNNADINEFETLLETQRDSIAAVLLEPIVQGAGGMRFYSPHYLKRVRALCDEHGVLLICDEIATGFGRTGKLFAVEHAGIVPDILCIGKALSGGFMSFAATLTTSRIAEVCSSGKGVLMHGPTFMGNPLACAVSLASLRLLRSATYDWQSKVAAIETQLTEELDECRALPGVHDVRVLGAIGVVELNEPLGDMKRVQQQLVQQGVWLRPFGRLLYTMPPFLIQPHQLRKITKAMVSLASRRRA